MGLRRFSDDLATAARPSSTAFAHAALAGGSDKPLPFRGAMGLEAHSSLARLQEAWPTAKGFADSPDDAAEWTVHKPDCKVLRTSALQREISHADADARAAALFATLEADAKGASLQARSAARLPHLCNCTGLLASAWLTARPGPAGLTAVEFCISTRLRLGEDLFACQDGDVACVCGRSMEAGGTHSLTCVALWHTVVARHNALTETWLCIAARGRVTATCEPRVKQLPQPFHGTGDKAACARTCTGVLVPLQRILRLGRPLGCGGNRRVAESHTRPLPLAAQGGIGGGHRAGGSARSVAGAGPLSVCASP